MTVNEFCKIDGTFNESLFLSKVNNIFVQLFSSLMFNRLEEVNHFIGEELYNQYFNKLEELRANNLRQIYDELSVKFSRISSISIVNDKYVIKVFLEAKYLDYIIKLDNKKIVKGNNFIVKVTDYELIFEKSINADVEDIIKECSNCGASLDVNDSGICSYCGSVYNQERYDWALTGLNIV